MPQSHDIQVRDPGRQRSRPVRNAQLNAGVSGFGFCVFRVWGLEFRVWGFRVWGFGFRVSGLGLNTVYLGIRGFRMGP